MPVRSGQLAHGTIVSQGTPRLFQVPVGFTVLVKSAYGFSNATQAGVFMVSVEAPPAAGVLVIAQPTSPGTAFKWDGWLAIPEGWIVNAWNNSNGVVQYHLSGSLLPGVIAPLPATLPG